MQSAIYVVLRIEVDPNLFCSNPCCSKWRGVGWAASLIWLWFGMLWLCKKLVQIQVGWAAPDPRTAGCFLLLQQLAPSPSSCSLQWATILPTVSIEIGRNLWKYSYCDISNLVKLSPPAAAAPPPSPAACSEPLFVLLWTWIESDRNCETLRAKMFWFWHLKLFSPPAWVGETGKCQRETIEHYWFMRWQGIQLFDWRQNCFRKWKKQKLYVNYLWTESVSN